MNPIKNFGPSFPTHCAAHLPASNAQLTPPARPGGPKVVQSHLPCIPSHILRGARSPIKVGSFKLPKGVSKNRLAALLKPLGEVTELGAVDSRRSSDDSETCYRYRAQDFADGSGKPTREVEVRVQVDNDGQLKRLTASLHPDRGHEAQPDRIEVDFYQFRSPNKPVGNLERTLNQRGARPSEQVKFAEQKLAQRINEIHDVIEQREKRNEEIAALEITY